MTLFNSTPSAGSLEGISKSNHQLPDGILPPRRASVKDIQDGALKEHLGIVYGAVDVLRGMVAQNSVQDGVNDHAHLVPRVDLWHRKQ